MNNFQKIKITSGRSFVVGDIHGCFTQLINQLDNLNFDHQKDHLFSVGDLVDRGPESHFALDFLANPQFHAIRGNHEQMVIDAGGTNWHVQNGGQWFNELSEDEQHGFKLEFNKLPLIMEVELPNGKRIGLCHAAFPPSGNNRVEFSCDWNDAELLANGSMYEREPEVLWDRWQISRARKIAVTGEKGEKFAGEFNIKNIDHVYFGHTPLKEPLHVGNCSWIDTGAFAGHDLTIVEL